MKKKINSQFVGIAFIAVIATLLLAIVVFYELFKEQVFHDLKTDAYLIENSKLLDEMSEEETKLPDYNIRITLVDADGTVLFDTLADEAEMDNHATRPEIEDAFEVGEGTSIRQSETMDMSNFYYASQLSDGRVLRISKEAHSIWNILYRALPLMALIIFLLLILCIVLSRILAKSLLEPIELMAGDMEHMNQVECYEEIKPFIETIQQQHEAIVKNANMRQEFTANVSHELKTPLTAISGYSELIENGMATDQDVRRFGAEIHRNAGRLLTLINDIIRLSELDSTVSEVPFEPVNLYQIAMDSVNMLQVNAENHQVSLQFEGGLCYIYGDKQMMEELLYNLCDNAIRYNNKCGHVWVSVGKKGEQVVLRVKDTGIGIPKKHQERIFERFYRVDKSRSKSTGGTGLGLAIVKHIVAKHNAYMELDSEAGKGTEIRIFFPVYDGKEKNGSKSDDDRTE